MHAGYSGPYPSAAAQRALHQIEGRTLPDGALGAAGTVLEIESFAVVPNPVTGKGPVLRLRRHHAPVTPASTNERQGENGAWYLPVLTDGDAADVIQLATGSAPANFGGETSAIYRETLALEPR